MTAEPPVVLVVDDEPEITALYAEYLRDDYDVITASSGEEGLELLDERVDVVLLDRGMPGLQGRDVLERIRARELGCRVALVTAYQPELDILDMELDTYLCKPVSRSELEETVATLLKRDEYDSRVQEYFSLLSKRAVLREEKTEAELATSDAYATMESRIEDLRERTSRIAADFDHEDYLVAFRDLGHGSGDERSDQSEREE